MAEIFVIDNEGWFWIPPGLGGGCGLRVESVHLELYEVHENTPGDVEGLRFLKILVSSIPELTKRTRRL